ncbi:MAG: pyruvate ferredoxin oxidoreductase [Actinobacteria bacterium]|nr:pyruvate ferredoxin oxidoreductase [Actinomycetota bacterium]
MSYKTIDMSRPSAGEAGRTGDWRSNRPVMQSELCSAVKAGRLTCQICWSLCPDACISQGMPPRVELEYCKGCGICAEECPTGAIAMRPEREHGTCDLPEADAG